MRLVRVPSRNLAFAVLALAGCAPDAWRRDPAYDAFLDRVAKQCRPLRIGTASQSGLYADALFLDDTSRLFHGRISREDWRVSMRTAYTARPDDPGMECLLSRLPPAVPARPGASGRAAHRPGNMP